ncbi:hypothetical protein AAZX31_10G052700 [Glycine max]
MQEKFTSLFYFWGQGEPELRSPATNTLTPLFLKARTTAQTASPLSTLFFSISLSASKWTPPPPPTPSSGASVFSRIANTSPTHAAALASHPFPHSNAPLSACSTVDAPATTLSRFPSTTFAVMCFPDTNTLKTYLLIIIPIPTHGFNQYNLGLSGPRPRPNTNYKKERKSIFIVSDEHGICNGILPLLHSVGYE